MVIDKMEDVLFYKPMISVLEAGVAAVKAIEELEPGEYRFDEGYFNIQKDETKPMDEDTFEVHRRYIDVQVLVERHEEVAQVDVGDPKIVIPYDKEKDVERLPGDTRNHVRIDQGMFYIVFPRDGHKPVSHTNEPHSFIETIVKILAPERA